MKTLKSITICIAFLVIISGCSKTNSTTQNNTTPPVTSSDNSIGISGMSFPGQVTIKAGTTVTWTNTDYMTHTVTSDNSSFDSPNLSYGDKFSFTFPSAGTFKYHCKYHSAMIGSIVVE